MQTATFNFNIRKYALPQGGSSTFTVSHKFNGEDKFTKFHTEDLLNLPGAIAAQNALLLPDDLPESCSLFFLFTREEKPRDCPVMSLVSCCLELSREDFSGEKLNFDVGIGYNWQHYFLTVSRVPEVAAPAVMPSPRQICTHNIPS